MNASVALYELAVLGAPTDRLLSELESCISAATTPFGLRLGEEIAWHVRPDTFDPEEKRPAAAVFFGAENTLAPDVEDLLSRKIPILPVASAYDKIQEEIPSVLRPLNCLFSNVDSVQRIASALLECIGLLPRQRRVFISYRRNEARQTALQLFEAFSARLFDVFLDTHGIAPGEAFQAMLWHRLCDSDVLIMLDTPGYFDSRWTSAEFGRALAKGISVLCVGWPNSTPSVRTEIARRTELAPDEIDPTTGRLNETAIARICQQLEIIRSQSYAVRSLNLESKIRSAVEQVGGQITGIGLNRTVFARLPGEQNIAAYPTVGVPTSVSLHDAMVSANKRQVAMVYDSIGLHDDWQAHLDWLGRQIPKTRWIKTHEAAWQFADWGA